MESYKARRNRSRKNQNVSISSDSVYDSVSYDPVKTRLSESEPEAEEPTNHKAHWIISDGVISGMGVLPTPSV